MSEVKNKGGRPKGSTNETALTTPTQVRTELVTLYRMGKARKIDTLDASRLAGILKIVLECISADDFEQRLAELEKKFLGAKNGKN